MARFSSYRPGFLALFNTSRAAGASGFTVTELLICCAIVALLIMLSTPLSHAWVQDHQLQRITNDYLNALGFARATAVTSGYRVTFCRSDDGTRCQGTWTDGSIIFTDRNGDGQVNGKDEVLRRFNAPDFPVIITFRAFQNKSYLQMTPLGFTDYQNGNFTFCPQDLNPALARQIIISRSGRARLAMDRDGDGIRENSQGKPLTCP